jgi:hypothetical protein
VAHRYAHDPTQPKLSTLVTRSCPVYEAERADEEHGVTMGNVVATHEVFVAPTARATSRRRTAAKRDHFILAVHHTNG